MRIRSKEKAPEERMQGTRTAAAAKAQRVLVVAYGHANRAKAYTHRIISIIKSLDEAGHDVLCLWFSPWYSCLSRGLLHDLRDKVRVIVWPVHPIMYERISGTLSRRVCSLVIRYVSRLWQADCIHTETELCASLAARARTGHPLVCDFHGDIIAEYRMKKVPVWALRQVDADVRSAMRSADAIVCASRNLRDKLVAEHGCRRLHTCVLPCSVHLDRFRSCREQRAGTRQDLGVANRKVLCYSGGTAVWQCIGEMIDLMCALHTVDSGVFFLILTHGDLSPWQQQLDMLRRDGSLLVLNLKPIEVPRFLAVADVGLLLRKNDPVNLASSPTKCAEYLAAGVPVLATQYAGDAPTIIGAGDCGYVLDDVHAGPADVDKVLRWVDGVVSDREVVAQRCVDTVMQHHNWDLSVARLHEMYSRLPGVL